MNIWSDQVIQFVENAVNDFNQKMALLILQGGGHEQGQDLVEQGTCSEFASFICDLTQSSLRGKRRSDNGQILKYIWQICY